MSSDDRRTDRREEAGGLVVFLDGLGGWRDGRLCVAFDREAASLEEAIEYATADVQRAGCEVKAVP